MSTPEQSPPLPPVPTDASAYPPVGDVVTKPERAQAVANLRAFLDEMDEQTRQPGEPPLREAVAAQARERLAERDAHTDQDPYQCQGCGAVRYGSRWRDKGHACWRNEDGTYEEGGTFQ